MVGEKPNNPLEAFLLLGKSVRGIAATQLVQQVTEAPNIFVFGELLQLDGIKEVNRIKKVITKKLACFVSFY